MFLTDLIEFFNQENIVSICDLLKAHNQQSAEDIYIVTELMETDLHRIIYSRRELTPDHIRYFIYQVLKGLQFMHSANVIHRDLKPGNLLVVNYYLSSFRIAIACLKYAI